jgi:hypothetical protein
MTQFILCVPEPGDVAGDLYFISIREDDDFLTTAARAIFPGEVSIRLPALLKGPSIADVFTDAHNAVYNGLDFSSTRLSAVMDELVHRCRSFALWWGNDWSDLPIIQTQNEI